MAAFLVIITLAGLVGTLAGAIGGISIHRISSRLLGLFLSLSTGILVSIIVFDLIPHALEHTGVVLTGSFVVIGIGTIGVVSFLFGHRHGKDEHHVHDHHDHHEDAIEICDDCGDEVIPFNDTHVHVEDGNLLKTGLVMMLAVSLHNIPSGLAIGAGYAHNQGVGIMLAILIGVHNLPEGMAMALPLVGSGMKHAKALFFVALTAIPTIIGGVVGYSLASVSETLVSILMSLAAGAMLYVTLVEMVPQARRMFGKRYYPYLALLGMIMGYVLVFFTHDAH